MALAGPGARQPVTEFPSAALARRDRPRSACADPCRAGGGGYAAILPLSVAGRAAGADRVRGAAAAAPAAGPTAGYRGDRDRGCAARFRSAMPADEPAA